MPGTFHTVTLPVGRTASRDLSWPPQDPGTRRTLVLDCTAWLADADATIAGVRVRRDPALIVRGVEHDGNVVRVKVTGGAPGGTAVVGIELTLANGDQENVAVGIPIIPLTPALAAGAVLAAQPRQILFAGRPVLFSGANATFGASA